MITAALVTFTALLLAWCLAPGEKPAGAAPSSRPMPVEEPLPEAA